MLIDVHNIWENKQINIHHFNIRILMLIANYRATIGKGMSRNYFNTSNSIGISKSKYHGRLLY